MKQSTDTLLAVKPRIFYSNPQTRQSNVFQQNVDSQVARSTELAQQELLNMLELLRSHGVRTLLVESQNEQSPDCIFPNNWFSTHTDGRMVLYPMMAPNRRTEKSPEVLSYLKKQFKITDACDLSYWEEDGCFLEGTGSLVLDRPGRVAFAALSERTHEVVVEAFCQSMGYRAICFHTRHEFNGKFTPVYHTNVLMSIGTRWAVLAEEMLEEAAQLEQVRAHMERTGRELIPITRTQMESFAGNMLEVCNRLNEHHIIMSSRAFESLSTEQVERLSKYARLIHSPLPTIEQLGGGSARCMLAEIFLEPLQ